MSKLTGLVVNRLLPSRDSTYYSTYNVEQAIRKSLRFIIENAKSTQFSSVNSTIVQDKILFYFLNDRAKYKIDFFKLYVMEFTGHKQGDRIRLTEFNHTENDPYYQDEKYGHEDYRFDKIKFDRS